MNNEEEMSPVTSTVTEEEMNTIFKDYIDKLFSGKYDITVTNEDESTLNISELLRLLIHTLRSVSRKVLDLEELDHSKKRRHE